MVQSSKIDTEMAKYILSILKTQLNIVLSWGFRSPIVVKNGLRFHTNGFHHKGWCEVVYDEGRDTFTFRTLGRDGDTKYEADDVYFDNLVEIIDYAVEKGGENEEQYKQRVNEWLGKCFA